MERIINQEKKAAKIDVKPMPARPLPAPAAAQPPARRFSHGPRRHERAAPANPAAPR